MTIECEHRTRPPSETLATRADELAREQAEADFDAGALAEEFFAHLPDDWAECVMAEAIAQSGSWQTVLELLCDAGSDTLWNQYHDARDETIREAMDNA